MSPFSVDALDNNKQDIHTRACKVIVVDLLIRVDDIKQEGILTIAEYVLSQVQRPATSPNDTRCSRVAVYH
jgi:hypothetical protein